MWRLPELGAIGPVQSGTLRSSIGTLTLSAKLPPRPELPPGYRIETHLDMFDVWLFRDAAVIGPKTRELAIERAWAHWQAHAGAWVEYLDALEKR